MKKIVGQLMLATLLVMTTANAHAVSFAVNALSNSSSGGAGLDTGIVLAAGEAFSVEAGDNDLWSAGALPRWSNADGLVGTRLANVSDDSGEPAGTLIGQDFGLWTQNGLSAPFGTLVGELNGTFFKLGTNFNGVAPASGTLKLYYWDSNFGDNTGTVLAEVKKTSTVPKPATSLLLLTGMVMIIGLAARRRYVA